MDVYRLSSDLKFVNQIGATLNIEEKLRLELAVLKLNESQKFDQILFWGKVFGIEKDYFVAIGLNFRGKYEFPIKSFFWTTNQNFEFSALPEINPDPEYRDFVNTLRSQFIGQHDKTLKGEEGEGGEGGEGGAPAENQEQAEGGAEGEQKEDEDSEEGEKKAPPKKRFTELDRLAYIVRAIDFDCQVIPIGAFKLTPTHELRYNESFKGLAYKDGSVLNNYQHFRNPQSEEKQNQIARDDALFHFDFLDSLTQDQPYGCWSIQTDSSKTNVTLRSLLWPGYVGYHRTNSNIFGGAYFGTGVKNVDLPFLL